MKGRILIWSMLVLFFSLVMFGCATTGPAFEPVSPEPKDDGGSVIYLYRSKAFAGSAVKFNLTVNATDEIALTNGGYYPYVCEPGEYTIVWKVGSKTPTVHLTVEEGESYYVKAWMKVIPLIIITFSEYHVEVIDPLTGQDEIMKCNLVE